MNLALCLDIYALFVQLASPITRQHNAIDLPKSTHLHTNKIRIFTSNMFTEIRNIYVNKTFKNRQNFVLFTYFKYEF